MEEPRPANRLAGTAAWHCPCQRSTLAQSASGMRARQKGQRLAECPTDRYRRKRLQWNARPQVKRRRPASCSSPK
eukprot:3154540-Alexandrium_andersonii.AAC.1